MSLILEALRKSEAERRRGEAPDVAVELSPPPASGRVNMRRWLWPVLATVTLFALVPVLAIWWIAGDSWMPDAASQGTPVPAEVPVLAPDVAPAVVPRAPAVVRAPPLPPLPPPAAPIAGPQAPLPTDAPPIPAPAPAPVAMPPAEAPPTTVGMSGVRLSMHLWNEDPSRRFVVLNGQRMMEGDRNGNLTLLDILRDGVVVERDGLRARIDLP